MWWRFAKIKYPIVDSNGNLTQFGHTFNKIFMHGKTPEKTMQLMNNIGYPIDLETVIDRINQLPHKYPLNKRLNDLLRSRTSQWRLHYLKMYGERCAITGKRMKQIDIHHIDMAFADIKEEIADLISLPYYEDINDYSPAQIDLLVDGVVQAHMKVRGIPISNDLHQEMNKNYGHQPTAEQLNEFILNKMPLDRKTNFDRKYGPEPTIDETLQGLRVLNRYDKWRRKGLFTHES